MSGGSDVEIAPADSVRTMRTLILSCFVAILLLGVVFETEFTRGVSDICFGGGGVEGGGGGAYCWPCRRMLLVSGSEFTGIDINTDRRGGHSRFVVCRARLIL